MLYSFDDAKAKERHTTQYFEIMGNRAIYHEGWFARTIHRAPWEKQVRRPLADDIWELYDTRTDFSLTHDLAAQNPKKLTELQALFLKEAKKNNVLPIDDRTLERINADLVNRPDLMAGRTSLTLAEGMTGMSENVFINVKNKSKTITAELDIPEGGANGVVLAQGGRFGGWCLYLKDGKPAYTYNYLNQNQYTISSAEALPKGKSKLVFEFAYDGGGLGKGGNGTLSVDGRKLAEGRIDKTQPMAFSADETADVGIDDATPVVAGIGLGAQTRFTGKIEKVTIEVK